MEIIEKIKNDNKLYFDHDFEMYVLTKAIIGDKLINTFQDDNVLQKRAIKNSKVCYNYIYKHSYSGNREIIKTLLNHTEQGRKFLINLLLAQMEADLSSGYNSLGNRSRLNKQGNFEDKNQYEENLLCPEALEVVEQSMGYFGINLLYTQPFTIRVPFFDDSKECEEEDKYELFKCDDLYVRISNDKIKKMVRDVFNEDEEEGEN